MAGHVERMEGVLLRSDALGVEGRIRQGRPRLRWRMRLRDEGEWR